MANDPGGGTQALIQGKTPSHDADPKYSSGSGNTTQDQEIRPLRSDGCCSEAPALLRFWFALNCEDYGGNMAFNWVQFPAQGVPNP